ncbi:MAG: ABC transporter ATP-binding protein [Anaerolineae bacterium]
MEERSVIVETRDLVKVYGDGPGVRALDGVNLSVHRGELVTVMGPSGSGKSTLLNMIGALDRPTSGQVIVKGEDLSSIRDLDAFRAQEVGFVFQLHNLIPTLTALENVEIPMHGQVRERQRRKRARELLDLVGLIDRAGHLPSQLSGGERQRVAVARALANQPAILLADEPTGSLDTTAGQEIMELLQKVNRERGMTIIVVTHDRKVARMTQRILTLEDGRIVDDHPVQTPLIEDLRELAHSHLGQSLLDRRGESLKELGLGSDEGLTEQGEYLRGLLVGLT